MLDELTEPDLVPTCLRGLSPAAHLLLAMSRRHLSATQQERIHEFLTAHGKALDWGAFIDQACRHGVLPLVGRHLTTLRLTHTAEGRALAPYRWIYAYVYDGNRLRNLALGDEYAKVIRGLNAAGIAYAVRKGPVLTDGVYHDVGLRRMGDLDLLMCRESLPEFAAMVEELGYRQGHLSRNADQVVPFDRSIQLVWRVSLPNSTLPFLKPAQRDDVEAFVLDPCFNLFQPRSGITADTGALIARGRDTTAFGEPTRMLDPVDQVIDACVQLHVEATTLMYIELGKDLTLLKFLDLVELLRGWTDEQVKTLVGRVREYGCGDSIYYALYHASQVYPDGVAPALLAEFQPTDPDILDVYGVLDEKPHRWEQDFAARLFDPRRWQSLRAHSAVPGPRAVV